MTDEYLNFLANPTTYGEVEKTRPEMMLAREVLALKKRVAALEAKTGHFGWPDGRIG